MITRGLARSQTQAQRKGQMKRDFSQAVNKGEDYLVRDRARNEGGAGALPGGFSGAPNPGSTLNVVPGAGRALSPGVAGAWHCSRSEPQKHRRGSCRDRPPWGRSDPNSWPDCPAPPCSQARPHHSQLQQKTHVTLRLIHKARSKFPGVALCQGSETQEPGSWEPHDTGR